MRALGRKLTHFALLARQDGLSGAVQYACERYNPLARKRYTQEVKKLETRYSSTCVTSEFPKISVVVPVYNPVAEHLKACIDSIRSQTYRNVELCLCDDGSTSEVRDYLRTLSHSGVRVVLNDRNTGISQATNRAIQIATGDYVAFVDNDDVLPKYALEEVAKRIAAAGPDFLYTDEDKLFPDGTFGQKFNKPGYSPELLLACNYVGHLSVVRKRLGNEIGWLRSEYDGSQDYDFVLRVFEQTERIMHVPVVCYHWRVSETSVASGPCAKPYAYERAVKAINDALRRRGINAVGIPVQGLSGHYRLYFEEPAKPFNVIIECPTSSRGLLDWAASLKRMQVVKDVHIMSGAASSLFTRLGRRIVSTDSEPVCYVRATGWFDGPAETRLTELAQLLSTSPEVGLVAPTFARNRRGSILSAGIDRSSSGTLVERTGRDLRMVIRDYRNHWACRTWLVMMRFGLLTELIRAGIPDTVCVHDLAPGQRIVVDGHVVYTVAGT